MSCMVLLRGADWIKILAFGANTIYLRLWESIGTLHMFNYEFFGPGFDPCLCSTYDSFHLFLLWNSSTILFSSLAPLQLFIFNVWRGHLFSLEEELLGLIPINKPILIWNERLTLVYYSFRFSPWLFFDTGIFATKETTVFTHTVIFFLFKIRNLRSQFHALVFFIRFWHFTITLFLQKHGGLLILERRWNTLGLPGSAPSLWLLTGSIMLFL